MLHVQQPQAEHRRRVQQLHHNLEPCTPELEPCMMIGPKPDNCCAPAYVVGQVLLKTSRYWKPHAQQVKCLAPRSQRP
jgi:hypothetical protein